MKLIDLLRAVRHKLTIPRDAVAITQSPHKTLLFWKYSEGLIKPNDEKCGFGWHEWQHESGCGLCDQDWMETETLNVLAEDHQDTFVLVSDLWGQVDQHIHALSVSLALEELNRATNEDLALLATHQEECLRIQKRIEARGQQVQEIYQKITNMATLQDVGQI